MQPTIFKSVTVTDARASTLVEASRRARRVVVTPGSGIVSLTVAGTEADAVPNGSGAFTFFGGSEIFVLHPGESLFGIASGGTLQVSLAISDALPLVSRGV